MTPNTKVLSTLYHQTPPFLSPHEKSILFPNVSNCFFGFWLYNRSNPLLLEKSSLPSILASWSYKIKPDKSILLLILTNRSCKVDPVKSILASRSCKFLSSFRETVSILQKRSNLIIHVLPNPLNQKWSRNFNNYRNVCECLISLRIALFTNFSKCNAWGLT